MLIGVKPMACGNCGHGLFRMFIKNSLTEGLLAECAQCKSVSTITASKPEVEIGWGEGADGILCQQVPKS